MGILVSIFLVEVISVLWLLLLWEPLSKYRGQQNPQKASIFPAVVKRQLQIACFFLRKQWLLLVEVALIAGFSILVGAKYLDLQEDTWVYGYEFPVSIQSQFNWINFNQCGLCFLWNGSLKGGSPSLVDLRGSWLHPLVALSTLLLGFINGTKVYLVVFLFHCRYGTVVAFPFA